MQHVPMAAVFALKAGGVENQSVLGALDREESWIELIATAGATYLIGTGVTYGLKHTVREWRPDDSDRRSFPSGHAMYAFAGATTLYHEYGHISPWVTVSGFGTAALVAADRVRRDRHYLHDVCAGAAIGVLSAELTYYIKKRYIKPKIVAHSHQGRHRSGGIDVAFTGQSVSLLARW